MITIINYGMGNLGSIVNMFKYIGVPCEISDDLSVLKNADKLLLPGVGAFDAAMNKMQNIPGLLDVLREKALIEKNPILGICLGMQLLTNHSEEGRQPGLGFIPGKTLRFPSKDALKVPHMGWNLVNEVNPSPLTTHLPEEPRFYFVHSYYVKVNDPAHRVMTTTYDVTFDSVIQNENIFGAQFHPEKSHKFGMQLLKNFASV